MRSCCHPHPHPQYPGTTLMTTIHSLHCSFINYNITDRAYRRTVISLPVLMMFCCRAIMSHARRTLSPQFQVRWTKNIRRHAKVDYFISFIGSSWLRETEHFHFFYFKPWSPFKRTLFQPRYNSHKVKLDVFLATRIILSLSLFVLSHVFWSISSNDNRIVNFVLQTHLRR